MANEKVHELIVKIRFDRPISRSQAVREFKDNIHGEFYPGGWSDAQTMKIVSTKSGGRK